MVRATIPLAVLAFALGAAEAGAIPVDCLGKAAPFTAQLLKGQESGLKPLLDRAVDLWQGGSLGPIPQDEAAALADAAQACIPLERERQADQNVRALSYLAIRALERLVRVARDPLTARAAADRIRRLADGLDDSQIQTASAQALKLANKTAAVGPRPIGEEALQREVLRVLARQMAPGGEGAQDYLDAVRRPLRDTLEVLTQVAVAFERMRSVTEDMVSKPPESSSAAASEDDLLSNGEREQLARLRDRYEEIFDRATIGPRPTAVVTSLLELRNEMGKALGPKVGLTGEQKLCFTETLGEDSACAAFEPGDFRATKYPPDALQSLIPLTAMDRELRRLAALSADVLRTLYAGSLDKSGDEDRKLPTGAELARRLDEISKFSAEDAPPPVLDHDLAPGLEALASQNQAGASTVDDWCEKATPERLAGLEAGEIATTLRQVRRALNAAAASATGNADPDEAPLGAVCTLLADLPDTLKPQDEGDQQ